MNQIRNLILNVLFNVVFMVLLIHFNFTITSDHTDILPFIIFTLIEVVVMSIIIGMVQSDMRDFTITPPIGVATLIYLLIEYLKGKVKLVKSEYGSYIARYDNEVIKIYVFKMFSYVRIYEIAFNGSEECIQSVHEYFKSIKDKRIEKQEERKKRQKKINNFKEWDGTVDAKTKRIDTINKIIR